ncbi:MAG TPA: cyclic nucleotide-binding domain-containing protein [Afifellaceae bacterium]|nr:cyclic nucleotide-binding domain-containing protein [Afifellaceae bacterium]
MTLASDIALLRQTPFFESFSEEHLKLIAFSAESRSFAAGMVLYEEGQLLHSAYIIGSGRLEAVRKERDGEATRAIGPGETLAERALLLETRARETVTVTEAATALQMRRPVFRRFLEEYPEIATLLRARIAARLGLAAAEYRAAGERLTAAGR